MSDIIKPPKLMFPGEDGQYYTEFIPKEPGFIESKIDIFKRDRRIKKNKDLYYWHYKSLFPPKIQKIVDINFILHMLKDHRQEGATDREELKYFNKIYPIYQKEVDYFLMQKYAKWRKHKHAKNIYLQKDPYYVAYKKHWVDTFSFGPNFKLFYHGVGLQEAMNLLETLINDINYTDTIIAKSYKMTLEEFRSLVNNPSPDLIKDSQKPAKEPASFLQMINLIYWISNFFITFVAILMFNLYDAETYSFWGRLGVSLGLLIGIEIILITPYLILFGLYKLLKKLSTKKDPKPDAQPEE